MRRRGPSQKHGQAHLPNLQFVSKTFQQLQPYQLSRWGPPSGCCLCARALCLGPVFTRGEYNVWNHGKTDRLLPGQILGEGCPGLSNARPNQKAVCGRFALVSGTLPLTTGTAARQRSA